jgi:hypothetical protein
MNISKALKQKTRLVKEINQKWEIVTKQNSIIVGNKRNFDVSLILKEIFELTNQLVSLKEKIHLANAPIYSKIFRMSELKNMLKLLKSIDTKEGTVDSRYGQNTNIYEVQISDFEKNKMIEEVNKEIDQLQDELDYFNAVTQIEE